MLLSRARQQAVAASLVIVGMFYYFARPGLTYYFTDDDVMNLRRAWPTPVHQLLRQTFTFDPNGYRPAGLLFYRSMFSLAGLDPRPFHWVCFAFLVINLALLFLLAKTLTNSNEIALLATLIGCFHSRMDVLYFTASTIYDILCYTFYFTFLLCYIHYRRKTPLLVFIVLDVLALNAKEMAVTLPVMIAAYELLYRSPALSAKWLLGEGRVLLASTLLTAVFCIRKLAGATPLVTSYRPQFSFGRLFDNWQSYLSQMVYSTRLPPRGVVVAIWILLVAVAFLLKSKPLKFCCVLILLGPLPACVVEPRGFSTLYIPFTGWVIYAATLLVYIRERVLALFKPGPVFLFLGAGAALAYAHAQDRPNRFYPGIGKNDLVRNFKDDFVRLHPTMPAEAHILLLDDPFESVEWTPSSLLQLYYREPELDIQRVKQQQNIGPTKWDHILTYKDGHMVAARFSLPQ